MRVRRVANVATSITAVCIIAALALPAASATAAQRSAAGASSHTYLIFLKTPSQTVSTGRERALVVSSQSSVSSRLVALGVKPLEHYLAPDVIVAKMRPAQLAAMRLLPGVATVLRNGLIPGPTATFAKLRYHETSAKGAHALAAHVPAGVCGTAAKPQLNPEALVNINAEPAITSGADGAGVKVAFIADGLDPKNADFKRNAAFKSSGNPAGKSVITSYVDFGGDGTSAPTSGGEAFLDASSMVAQGNQKYDLSGFVNPAHPLPTGCDITIQGDAPGADLTAIKVFANSFTTNADFVAAINYAVTSGVKVLNESFGSNPFPDDSLEATKLADDAAVAAGVTVVVSTGDAGITNTIGTPADDPNVIAAGASTTLRTYAQFTYGGINAPGVGKKDKFIDNNISSISSSGFAANGKTVDIVAPGDSNWALCSTSSKYADCGGQNIEFTGGTSESAPLTAGGAADVIQAYAKSHHGADPTPALVKQILMSSAQNIDAPGVEQGAGLLDIGAAVDLARSIKGTTSHTATGGIVAGTGQLDLSGAPGASSSATVSLTNTTTAKVKLHPYVRELVSTGDATGTVTMDPSTSTHQPNFTIWSGLPEVYQKASFSVPSGTKYLSFANSFEDTGQNSLLHVALFSPSGAYAGYNILQGLSDYSNIGVADPAAGKWTAVFFTVWNADGAGDVGTSGPAPWVATFWKFRHTGSVSHTSLSISAGKTASLKVTLTNPSSPGDTGYSLVVGGKMSLPITLRTIVPVASSGLFSGVLTGGNGRAGAPAQTDFLSFTVPAGKNDLDASIALSSNPAVGSLAGIEMYGELVDPSGQVQAFDTNYTIGSGGPTVTPYVSLYKSHPVAGQWELVLFWANPVTGASTSVPYTGAIDFNLVSESNNLPDSSATDLSQAVTSSFSVTVHNTGVAPLLLTPDARLTTSTSYPLSDALGGSATHTIPGVADNTYFIPNETSSVSVNQTSTVPASFDFSSYPGDPDLSPLNGATPYVTSTQTSSSASLTFAPPAGVTPGLWFDGDSVIGPFGKNAATSGTETTSVSIHTLAFDTAVSSADGDYVQALVTGGTGPNDVEVDPGTSVSIPIGIHPNAPVSTTVAGTLYIVGLSGPGVFLAPLGGVGDLFANELAAIPYTYTVIP
jgi:hypothetical protein